MSRTLEELIARSRAGDRAAGEQLIVENSGLIWSIARRYFGRGVDPDDLYQLGCLGFLKAVEGYDTALGRSFPPTPCRKSPEKSAAFSGTTARSR